MKSSLPSILSSSAFVYHSDRGMCITVGLVYGGQFENRSTEGSGSGFGTASAGNPGIQSIVGGGRVRGFR